MTDTDDSPPTMYRVMLFDEQDGLRRPRAGSGRDMLGASLPPTIPADISPSSDGMVGPGDSGMSVAPSLRALPPGLVPERLRDLRPGARGRNDARLFRLGDGPFRSAPINADLEQLPTSKKHGVVRPARDLHIDDFQAALAFTRDA